MDKQLTFGSLFAGIGGFDLGFERAGMKCEWQVEIDPFCQKVLRKHFPHAKLYGDICKVKTLPYVDVICGGFPCQDISGANPNGKGLDGERSGLWYEYARIIRKVKPRWVVVENVSRLLSINDGRDFGIVLRDLASCGYDAEWDVLSACELGAPHSRERVFLVAYPNAFPKLQTNSFFNPYRVYWKTRQSNTRGFWNGRSTLNWSIHSSDVLRVANGIPERVDRSKSCGNAVVPQITEWIGKRIIEIEKENQQ